MSQNYLVNKKLKNRQKENQIQIIDNQNLLKSEQAEALQNSVDEKFLLGEFSSLAAILMNPEVKVHIVPGTPKMDQLVVPGYFEDDERERIMPVAKTYKIKDIISACEYYFDKTKRRYIFEYVLINGKNDDKRHADALINLLKGLSKYPISSVVGSCPSIKHILKNLFWSL